MKYYEVFVEPEASRPGEQRVWKFLVELADGDASEAAALAAVRKVGGAALRADFQSSSIRRATLVTRSPAELDSGSAVASDVGRVWVLVQPA
jgi:hypothetical protein